MLALSAFIRSLRTRRVSAAAPSPAVAGPSPTLPVHGASRQPAIERRSPVAATARPTISPRAGYDERRGKQPAIPATMREQAGRRALKIIVVGDGNVGKTSLIRRHATHKFREARNQTLGIDITTQDYRLAGQPISLVLWDIEGQRGERPFFFHGAQAALLVYDVTTPDSLRALLDWADRIRRYAPPGTPLIVAGNKADLVTTVPAAWGQTLAERVGARHHTTLSAKTDLHVARTFAQLATLAATASQPGHDLYR